MEALKCSGGAVASHVHPYLMFSMWRETASELQALRSSQDTPVTKHDGMMCVGTVSSIYLHMRCVCLCLRVCSNVCLSL